MIDKTKDNGIIDFMSVDEACDLYNRIEQGQPIQLDWKCHGRRPPPIVNNEQGLDSDSTNKQELESSKASIEIDQNDITNTEFDFDEDLFGNLEDPNNTITEKLNLKKREDQTNEKKTSLIDIMSDMRKQKETESS